LTPSISATEVPVVDSELSPAEAKVAAKKRRFEKAAADRKSAEDCIRSEKLRRNVPHLRKLPLC